MRYIRLTASLLSADDWYAIIIYSDTPGVLAPFFQTDISQSKLWQKLNMVINVCRYQKLKVFSRMLSKCYSYFNAFDALNLNHNHHKQHFETKEGIIN